MVGYVGRLAPDRSPGLLLLALAEVKQQLLEHGMPEGAVGVVVVGDGPLRPSLQEKAAAELLWSDGRPLVHWVGNVDRGDVARWYSVMDVVVNVKQAETFGIANAEAAAAG
jgi:glycosyltransferase involved in cell wall biosynthesis